jgi:hypothetical protein
MTIMMICKKSYTLDPSDVDSRYKTCIRRVRSLQTESSKCLLPEKANSKTTHYGSQGCDHPTIRSDDNDPACGRARLLEVGAVVINATDGKDDEMFKCIIGLEVRARR